MSQNRFPHRPFCTRASTEVRLSETPRRVFDGEKQALEYVLEGVRLLQVLNELCSRVDVQLAGVISVIFLAEDAPGYAHCIAESAAQFGLNVLWSRPILSTVGQVLGTFEVYCCGVRSPDLWEEEVVDRATRLAAVAIQESLQGRAISGNRGQMRRTGLHLILLPN